VQRGGRVPEEDKFVLFAIDGRRPEDEMKIGKQNSQIWLAVDVSKIAAFVQ
jgi:hypothetical protein